MKLKTKLILLVSMVLFVLIQSVSFSSAQQKGAIKFVILTDMTGPLHAQVGPTGWATEDYFSWLNKHGGIDGHPVEAVLIDTKYQLPLIRTAYTRVKQMKHAAVSFDALSGGIEALRYEFAKDKIPVLMITGHGPALYPPSWVIGSMPGFDDVLCAYADYIEKNWKEKRSPRLALLLGDYASGRAPGQAKWYCEKKGIQVVAVEYVPLMPTDTSDIMIRIRDAKPDFIFDTCVVDMIKVVLRDRLKLGIKIPQVSFYMGFFLITKTVPPSVYDGYMSFASNSGWWEKNIPGIQFAYELYKKRGETPPDGYVTSIGACMVWAEAVKNALKKVGYEGLNGPAIYDGYMGIKNFTAQGIYHNYTCTKEDPRGNKWLKICRLDKDGSITDESGWIEAPWHLKLKAEMEKGKK